MQAWRIKAPSQIVCEELPSLSVGSGCVKVKIRYSTLSRTDRLIYSGKISCKDTPLIIGREAVAMVTEVGENVKKLQRGDMVAIIPYVPCHNCSICNNGEEYKCNQTLVLGRTEDGTMRDFAVFAADDLYKIPESIKLTDALMLDVIETAFDAISTLNLEKGQFLLITGATDLGLLAAQIALYYQITPIITDDDESRLAIASKFGVTYSINTSASDCEKKVFMITAGKLADAALFLDDGVLSPDATASLIKRFGKIAFTDNEVSIYNQRMDISPIINKQLSVYGITGGSRHISTAINMLATKRISSSAIDFKEIEFNEVAAEIETGVVSGKKTIVKMP